MILNLFNAPEYPWGEKSKAALDEKSRLTMSVEEIDDTTGVEQRVINHYRNVFSDNCRLGECIETSAFSLVKKTRTHIKHTCLRFVGFHEFLESYLNLRISDKDLNKLNETYDGVIFKLDPRIFVVTLNDKRLDTSISLVESSKYARTTLPGRYPIQGDVLEVNFDFPPGFYKFSDS
jgi:hypothetical protein